MRSLKIRVREVSIHYKHRLQRALLPVIRVTLLPNINIVLYLSQPTHSNASNAWGTQSPILLLGSLHRYFLYWNQCCRWTSPCGLIMIVGSTSAKTIQGTLSNKMTLQSWGPYRKVAGRKTQTELEAKTDCGPGALPLLELRVDV